MSSLDCISDASKNCCQSGKCMDSACPDTHECCTQKTRSPRLGLCVKKGQCNRDTGLPKNSCRENRENNLETVEKYTPLFVYSKEGYDGSEFNIKNAFLYFLIVAVVIYLIVYILRNGK